MAIDGIILNKFESALKDKLPARINKIHQISTHEILFSLRMEGVNTQLIISCHSVFNRIHFTNKSYPTGNTPTQFLLNLRRHLEGGTLYNVRQGGLDRYLVFEIAHRNEIKDKETLFLYVELMGKYANIILVNEDNKIIDALKRIPPFENSKRTIQKGSLFTLPEAQDKLDPFITEHIDATQSLTSQFHGFSPLLSREIEYRLESGISFRNIMETIQLSNRLYISKNDPNLFHIIPLTHLEHHFEDFDYNEGLDYIYFVLEEKERIKQATGDLFKFTLRSLKQLNNKLPKLLSSLDDAKDCERWKHFGELLYTHQIVDTKGQTSITIEDYDGTVTTIPLDAKLDGKGNAKKHFTKYQKGRKGQHHLIEQIEKCEQEIEYFKAIEEQLELASYDDAKDIKQDLINQGYLKIQHKPNQKIKKKEISLQMISYKTHTILFGKNNIQNDYLTFKVTNKHDTWFHAKDYHGAHVSVNTDNPDEQTLRLCAQIAAFYSKGRYSSSVPVNYCLAKSLKKIPGSQIGLVSLSQYKTIYIDPDANLIESLLIMKR